MWHFRWWKSRRSVSFKKNPVVKSSFIKVLNKADEEVLAQELCIYNDEYSLMRQCWKKQRKERITLEVLNEKLNEMRQKMKSGA